QQAVLVRTSHHSDLLEIELSARGVPYVKYGGLRFTEAAHVKDFIAAARVVANPADNLAWFRLLRLHEGIGPVLARRAMDALALTAPGGWWPPPPGGRRPGGGGGPGRPTASPGGCAGGAPPR